MSDRHAAQPRLAGHYGPTVAVALLALCPNIVLTTAFPLLRKQLLMGIGCSPTSLQTAEGLSNAGYAFGAVVAAWLVQRYRQRTLFLVTEAVFVAGSVLAAVAPGYLPFATGRVLQGATTGLMLVIALPPLITQFPSRRLPATAVAVNIGLFGAVTAGPLLASGVTAGEQWRLLFGGVAALGVAGFVTALLTLGRMPPFNPGHPPDGWAFGLAAAATVLPFLGVSQLVTTPFVSLAVLAPLAAGLVALTVLVVYQYRHADALMPVRPLSTSLPVTGTVAAMVGGAAFVTLLELTTVSLLKVQHVEPAAAGLRFWPEVVAVAIAAGVFGALFRTKWLPVLVLAGLLVLVAGGVLLTHPSSPAMLLAGVAALGLGAGASVSPGLFLAGLGVPSNRVGRAFALVELLRAEAAYLVGPVLLHVAQTRGGSLADELRLATWLTVGVTVAGLIAVVVLYLTSGARMHPPDLDAWLGGDDRALHSPATAGLVRAALPSAARRVADAVRRD